MIAHKTAHGLAGTGTATLVPGYQKVPQMWVYVEKQKDRSIIKSEQSSLNFNRK